MMTDDEKNRLYECVTTIGKAVDGLTKEQAAFAVRYVMKKAQMQEALDAIICVETHPECNACRRELDRARRSTLCLTPGIGDSVVVRYPQNGGHN